MLFPLLNCLPFHSSSKFVPRNVIFCIIRSSWFLIQTFYRYYCRRYCNIYAMCDLLYACKTIIVLCNVTIIVASLSSSTFNFGVQKYPSPFKYILALCLEMTFRLFDRKMKARQKKNWGKKQNIRKNIRKIERI